ncbi:hypothetical protein MNBD_IGNAVI01-628 [hydrothermal vent metagenome]|uniref:DUF4199 domain-containing protein n=1 Tax=hydrothermal vent metagenome TaxID=652676 RepID=A0A3B1DDE8_9ZZZZ
MKKYLSPLIVGFGAGVLSIVPVAKSFGCCLIIPVAAFIALLLEQKANNDYSKMEIKQGLLFGLLTGLYAALFGTILDFFITFITKNNDIVATYSELQKMINQFPISEELKDNVMSILGNVVESIRTTGISLIYTFSVLVNNLILNSVFGMLGGIIGVQILNSRNQKNIT